MIKFFFSSVLLLLSSCFISVNKVQAQVNFHEMGKWQDSLLRLEGQIKVLQSDAERLEKNFVFVKTLVSSLKERHAYLFNFDKLSSITVLRSPDDSFRIFSWNVDLNDGSYLYYGAIQRKTKDGKLSLVPLLDKTFEIQKPEEALLSPDNWYGARYYDIQALGDAYVLLGWKGHNADYTQKVIEILHLQNDQFILGKTLFADQPNSQRRIFNFSKQASMYLKFDRPQERLIFDHIVPANSSFTGNFKYYGPDLSYDAYLLKGGKLLLKSDVPFANAPHADDNSAIIPGQAIPKMKSGL